MEDVHLPASYNLGVHSTFGENPQDLKGNRFKAETDLDKIHRLNEQNEQGFDPSQIVVPNRTTRFGGKGRI